MTDKPDDADDVLTQGIAAANAQPAQEAPDVERYDLAGAAVSGASGPVGKWPTFKHPPKAHMHGCCGGCDCDTAAPPGYRTAARSRHRTGRSGAP